MALGPGTKDPLKWLEDDIDRLISSRTTRVEKSFRAENYPNLDQGHLNQLAGKYNLAGWQVSEIGFGWSPATKKVGFKTIDVLLDQIKQD